jgi:hypothetical protein
MALSHFAPVSNHNANPLSRQPTANQHNKEQLKRLDDTTRIRHTPVYKK